MRKGEFGGRNGENCSAGRAGEGIQQVEEHVWWKKWARFLGLLLLENDWSINFVKVEREAG